MNSAQRNKKAVRAAYYRGAHTVFGRHVYVPRRASVSHRSWAYPAIEMLWRGETHSSMALAGGICLCLINHICCGVLEDNNIFSRCLAGAGIITGVELVLGLVLNCLLGFDIWDYSNVPLNLLGQVCLPYSFLWMGISLPAMALCELCREDSLEEQARKIFTKKKR